jgi:hypothetical protein
VISGQGADPLASPGRWVERRSGPRRGPRGRRSGQGADLLHPSYSRPVVQSSATGRFYVRFLSETPGVSLKCPADTWRLIAGRCQARLPVLCNCGGHRTGRPGHQAVLAEMPGRCLALDRRTISDVLGGALQLWRSPNRSPWAPGRSGRVSGRGGCHTLGHHDCRILPRVPGNPFPSRGTTSCDATTRQALHGPPGISGGSSTLWRVVERDGRNGW